jgi:hypothetical protein
MAAESLVTIATKPSRRALALPHSMSTTLCCVPRRLIASDQLSGNTGCWVACPPAPETCISYSSTMRQNHIGGVKRHHVQPRGLCGGMKRALRTGGMALPLSVLIFLQQPATHSQERGLEEEELGEVGVVSNWCLYIS